MMELKTTNLVNSRRRDAWMSRADEYRRLAKRFASTGREQYVPLMERGAALADAIALLFDEDQRESAKKAEEALFEEARRHPTLKLDWY